MRVSEFLVFVYAVVCSMQASYGAGHDPDEDLVFTCRQGWTLYEGVCYLSVNVPMNYNDSYDMCWRQGGSLFQPINQQQFYSLKDMLPDIFWTDVSQRYNGDWELRRKRELFSLESFSLWANYQPMMNSGKIGCVSINKLDGGYVNVLEDCTYKMYSAVCQYDACLEGFVPCDNGRKCIQDPRDVCNDVDDCMDKSDERNCPNKCKNYLMLIQRSGDFSTGTIVDGKDCWWSLEAPIGDRIKLYVPAMILETNVAYIEVWSGDPSIGKSIELERLTGSIPAHYLFSRNNFLHLRVSAGDLTRSISSMNFNWTTEIPGISREESVLDATDQYQELAFPISFYVYEDLGPYGLNLYWRITVAEGNIISYHLNCRRGRIIDTPIKVRDGALESWQDTATGIYYTTASNTLRVWMTYDSRIGPFTLSYRSGCHVSLSRLSGRILSPGYSLKSIPHELQCDWTLNAGEMQDPPRGMSIKFLDIDLAADPRQGPVTKTTTDLILVEIDDSPTVLTPAQFDDNVANILHAPGGRIKLTLKSDVTLNSAGFVAEFGIDCEPLELSAETGKSTNDRFIDEKVTLNCPVGYQFDLEKYKDEDTVVLTCGIGGFSIDDSFIIPECQVVQCGTPPKITNGYIVNSTKTSYEGKAWYSCTQGSGLTGDAMVRCNSEGRWTSPPICTSSQCPVSENQLTVNNGGYEVVAGNEIPDSANFAEFNVIVKFFCDPGYELIGQLQSHCTELGWDHDTPPTCQRYRVGSLTCIVNQTIGQEDTCTDIDECAEGIDLCHSSTKCMNSVGGYTCECKSGYRRIDRYACGDKPECDDNKGGCSHICIDLAGSYGCACPAGYALYTSNGMHGYDLPDGENGLLDGDLYRFNHTCVRVPCPVLSPPSHGKHVFTRDNNFITTYKLYCDDGYALWIDGTQHSVVSDISCYNGYWTRFAECKARSCRAPPVPKYGRFDKSGVDFQGTVTLTCNYTMSRQVTRKAYCIYDAGGVKIAGENINECPVIDCGTPQLPLGGDYNGAAPLSTEHLDPGSWFHFQCGNGYDISGQTSDSQDATIVKCMENGRWDFGTIRCIGKQCPDPGTPVDATQIATSYEQGSVLRYVCKQVGFKPLLDGQDRTYTCDYDPQTNTARWSNNLSKSNLPSCTDVTSPEVVDSPADRFFFPMDTVEDFKEPEFLDNFGITSKVRTNYMESGDVILTEQLFVYTVTDFVGRIATDSFTYRIRGTDTKPNLECLQRKDILVSSDNDGTLLVKDMVEYDSTSTLAVSPTSVESTRTNIGTAQIATATLTDQYGRISSCTFMIHFTAGICFEELLYQDSNAVRICSETSSGLSCLSVCKANFIYKSGTTQKSFKCTGQNDWDLPLDLDIFCLPIEHPAYLADVALVYTSNGPVSSCLGPFQQTIQNHLANFEANIRAACNQMDWDVTVKTAGAVISIVQLDVTLQLNLIDTDTPTAARQACVDGLDADNADIFNVTGNIYPCSGRILNPTAVYISDPDISCETPSYQLHYNTGVGHVCVPCGPGYFYNSSFDWCERCPSEQYQDLANQMECQNCPTASASYPENIYCKNTCPPGFYSSDGYYPCEPCAIDTYWSDFKTCLSCPGNKSTTGLNGVKNVNECYDRDTKPKLECPQREVIPVSSNNDGTLPVKDMLEYNNTFTLAVSPTLVQSTRSNIGTAQIVTATLTDQYGRMSSCTFMIHFTAGICFEELLYPDSNAVRICSETSSGLSCLSVCKANFIYKSGTTQKTFTCTGQNDWKIPSDLDIFCLPIEHPAYLADVALVYTSNGPVSSCLGPFQQTIQNHLANFEANIRAACNQMDWDVTVKTAGAVISIVQLDVTLQLNLIETDTATAARQACVNGLDAANADIFNVTGNNYPCSGRTLHPTAVDISDPDISCVTPSYQLQLDTEAGHVCVPCGPGYFYNSGVDGCERCSNKQYQNLANQMQCETCPTASAPNVEKIDCKNTCPSGFYSSDGYYPCEPCGVDTYWSDSNTCLPCNAGSSTTGLHGAKSENECYEPCPVGSYSKTGYQVNGGCSFCPVGFYQPTTGQTQCMECDGDQTTNGNQKVHAADCIDLSSCSDYGCDTDGTDSCVYRFHRPVCICKSGFYGRKCQNKYEICDYNPCSEGSTSCTPIPGESNTDFTCTCREDLDTCSLSLVRTNVIAINTTLQYQSNEVARDVCISSCLDDARCQSVVFLFGFCYLYDRKLQDGQDLLSDNSITSEYMEKTCTKVFGGDRCELDLVDDCLTAGCAEGSMCMDEIDDFTCLCPVEGGVKGELCSDAADFCDPNPCDNGECSVFGTVRYKCTCADGYTGEKCDTFIDQCEENVDVCLYGGTCTPSLADYRCGCAAGFSGNNCLNPPDFCSQNDCLGNTCISRVDNRKGQCYCEGPLFTQDGNFACYKSFEPCDLLTCGNGGSCTSNAGGLTAHCECMVGWTGSTCQHNIDDCTDVSCVHGVCNDLLNGFSCTCRAGYGGSQCEVDTGECPRDCNNGMCVDGIDSYTCNCFSGYTGSFCEVDIDECNTYPCQHGGVCSEGNPGSYSCSCEVDWTGTNCETPVDSCEVSPCQNDGKCFTIVTDPVCRCEGGTQGRLCEEPSDLCEVLSTADLCQNNGVCRNTEGTATCRCKTEYSLDICYFGDVQDNLSGGFDYFLSESGADMDFCKKEGLQMENCDAVVFAFQFCFYYNATYLSPNEVQGSMLTSRICPTDYSGDSCQFVRDWCADGVCENGGTCTAVEPHGYQCQCSQGYSGVNCEIQPDPCDSNPCGNSGATCRTSGSVTDYICQCPEGKTFTGSFCRAPAPVASLLVNTMEGEDTTCLHTPFYLNSNSLSVLVKMKVYASDEDPVYFSLVSGPALRPMPYAQSNNFELKVTSQGIKAKFNGQYAAISYGAVFGSTLLNGEWHDIGISINSEGEMRSVIDAIEARNTANIGQNINFEDNAQICLGESVLVEYTNISVYDYVLTPQDFTLVVANKFNPTKNAVQNFWNYDLRPSTTRLSALLQVSPYPDASAKPPAMDCSGITRIVEHVLNDRFISRGGLTEVESNIDTIKQKNVGLTVQHTLPDELMWGYYEGIVVGMDEHHNYGQCRFSVYIKYNDKCPAPVRQTDDLQYSSCSNGDGACSVSCSKGSDGVTAALPKLMPCSKLGVYYTQSPHRDLILTGCNGGNYTTVSPDATCVHVDPASTKTEHCSRKCCLKILEAKVPPKYVVSASMQFLLIIPCSIIPQIESAEQVLREQFVQLDADKWTNICVNAQCSNIQFATASCDAIRENRFNLQFEVQLDKDSLDYVNGGSVNAADAMRMILMLEEDLSLSRFGNAVLLRDTVEISQYEKCTSAGYAMLWEGITRVCVPCGPGRHFQETKMGDDCLLCPIGYYQDEFAKMECKRCGNDNNGNPMTTYQLGATTVSQCIEVCSVGHFNDEVLKQCVKCARHYYQSESGQNQCEPCPVGYKTAIDGSTSRTDCKEDCPAGKYRHAVTQVCWNCSRGQWRSLEYDDCQLCGAGITTMIGELGTSVTSCNMGVCAPGAHWSTTERECLDCELGYFQSERAMLQCEKCSKNYTTTQTKSIASDNCTFYCSVGYEVVDGLTDTCRACPRGTYKDNAGTSKFAGCKDCTGGNTTDSTAAVSQGECIVLRCEAGKQYNAASKMCMDCPAGSYKENVGNAPDSCLLCPPNWTTIGPASTLASDCSQVVCGRGTYSDSSSGSIVCVPCAVGSYNSKTGQTACTLCVGKTTHGTGSDSITKCVEPSSNLPVILGAAIGGGGGLLVVLLIAVGVYRYRANADKRKKQRSNQNYENTYATPNDASPYATPNDDTTSARHLYDYIMTEQGNTQVQRADNDLTYNRHIYDYVMTAPDNTAV